MPDQQQKNIQPEDLFKLTFLQDAQIAPDGKHVVYSVRFTDLEADQDRCALWLLSLDSGEHRQITSGKYFDSSPRWSPDGSKIAFLSTLGGVPQIYTIPAAGGEPAAVTAMANGAGSAPAWSPDGRYIAFSAQTNPSPDLTKPYRVTRRIYRMNGMGYLEGRLHDLYIIPSAGGEPIRLTRENCNNSSPVWSPDGKEILYFTSLYPDSARTNSDLRLVDLAGESRALLTGWNYVLTAAWTPDGKRIVFIAYQPGMPLGTQRKLWVMDRDGGEPECRTANLDLDVGWGVEPDMPVSHLAVPRIYISQDGQFAYTRAVNGGVVHAYRIALRGEEKCTPVVTGLRSVLPLDVKNERMVFLASDFNIPTECCICDLDGTNEQQLTDLNTDFLGSHTLPEVERYYFPSRNGAMIEGWLVKPPFGKPPYPTVVYYHGGPLAGFGHVYHFDTQMLCGAGFAVMLVNFQGSSGYGNAFSRSIVGNTGKLELEDVMAGLDLAVQKGEVDPERLGCCGISYGGFMTCWTVGQTRRFKAAVSENPVTDYLSYYGTCDITWHCEDDMQAKPHEAIDDYLRCSPVMYAHQATTPTLMIQSEQDYRCPAGQTEEFYTILKANGCTTEMLRLPNSSHASSVSGSPVIRRAQNEALLDWMKRFLM